MYQQYGFFFDRAGSIARQVRICLEIILVDTVKFFL